jgi:hypothetical protein
MVMTKSFRLGGWHRLWIILSIIYSVFIFLAAYIEYPKNYQWTNTEAADVKEIDNSTVGTEGNSDEYLLNTLTPEEEVELKALEAEFGQEQSKVSVLNNKIQEAFQAGYSGEEIKAELSERGYDSQQVNNAVELVSGNRLKEKMQDSLLKRRHEIVVTYFLLWAMPTFSLYCMGWAIGWVYRGFRKSA